MVTFIFIFLFFYYLRVTSYKNKGDFTLIIILFLNYNAHHLYKRNKTYN